MIFFGHSIHSLFARPILELFMRAIRLSCAEDFGRTISPAAACMRFSSRSKIPKRVAALRYVHEEENVQWRDVFVLTTLLRCGGTYRIHPFNGNIITCSYVAPSEKKIKIKKYQIFNRP
jgi:hypothetical protein